MHPDTLEGTTSTSGTGTTGTGTTDSTGTGTTGTGTTDSTGTGTTGTSGEGTGGEGTGGEGTGGEGTGGEGTGGEGTGGEGTGGGGEEGGGEGGGDEGGGDEGGEDTVPSGAASARPRPVPRAAAAPPTPAVEDPVIAVRTSDATSAHAALIEMSCATPGAEIHYTTDLSDPDVSSPRYERPLELVPRDLPFTLKVRAMAYGRANSRVVARIIEVS